MQTIDGSSGEGGGQIIRTSLALSLITRQPFRITNVRARRERPGLQRQHLTAVRAAAEIGRADTEGAHVGAREFQFEPREVSAGEYHFSIGTAGSTTLVLQTVLPPLITASAPSVLTFEGGTHNVHAPPFEFIEKSFLPLINRMGARVEAQLERYGFYPPGGGRFSVLIEPAPTLRRLDILERGRIRKQHARVLVVNLPPHVAERELAVIRQKLDFREDQLEIAASTNAHSPGNVLTIEFESEHVTEVVSRIGERGVRAEVIAEKAAREAAQYVASGAPVGEHLADQLLIPLALAGGGSYTTVAPSLHTKTNIEVVKKFLPVDIQTRHIAGDIWKIEVSS
ncbi:MAG TPA: RNA 3'-terminal phosphate cyclase [Pyrinomonadaceae bacterium]|jgi:RNA 3'-terminal phosphate cyclase (ATP)